jgi:translocation and assembly module TamA
VHTRKYLPVYLPAGWRGHLRGALHGINVGWGELLKTGWTMSLLVGSLASRRGIGPLGTLLAVIFCLFLPMIPGRLCAAEPLEIVVRGVEGDILANVRAALAVPPGLVQKEKVNLLWLDRFEHQIPEKVREATEPFGYYNAKVSTKREITGDGSYRLVVDVVPGVPVRVTGVDVSLRGLGDHEESLKSLAASFPLRKGDVLREDIYEKAKGDLRAHALALGYLDASFPVHEILVSRQSSTADIRIVLDVGARYRFGEVRFEGAPEYPKKFLRRFLTFKRGEVFSYSKLGETQLNLVNSDRFRNVIISPAKEEAQNFEVPVIVRLEPAPSRRLRLGAGYGTDTGPRVTVNYRDLNLFKRGRELKLDLNLSTRLQAFGAGYTIPSAGSIDSFNEVQLNAVREKVTTYKNKLISLEGDRTRSFGKGRIGTAYLKVQEEDYTVGNDRSRARLIMPGLRFSARRYDSLIRPTHGYRYAFDLKTTHKVLGSSTSFVQLEADGDTIIPLPWRLSVQSRLKAGFTLQQEAFRELPASLRFFAGGDRSVRGYAYESLGPKDSNGNVIGGKNILVASVELDRAILSDWGIAAFFDIGNALDSFTNITLFKGAGVGVRYYTKIGALRLDLARQVGVPHPGFRVHFTVGFEQ